MKGILLHLVLKVLLASLLALFFATLALPAYVDLIALVLVALALVKADLSSLLIAGVSFFLTLLLLNFTRNKAQLPVVNFMDADGSFDQHFRFLIKKTIHPHRGEQPPDPVD